MKYVMCQLSYLCFTFVFLGWQSSFAATCVLKRSDLSEDLELPCSAFTNGLLGVHFKGFKAEGSFGKVFSGKLVYREKKIPVAIKQIRLKEEVSGYDDLAGAVPRPTTLETRKEFGLLVKLYQKGELRPYLVMPYAYFEYGGDAYLVMEDGGNALSSEMERFGQDPTKLDALARNLFAAIKALHDFGLVHLDLHPGNILVDDEGKVKIIDFGFAAPRGKPVTVTGHRQWRDPHVYEVKSAYPAYDYFSVAAMLFEIITGKKIFDYVATNQELEKNPLKPGTDNFERYVEIHKLLTEECAVKPCSKLYRLALALLHPNISQRTTKSAVVGPSNTVD